MSERQAIALQCKYGEDDDLIEWYLSIDKGSRQIAAKNALRKGLGFPIAPDIVTVDIVRKLINQELESFSDEVKQFVMAELSRVATVSSNGEETVNIGAVKETIDEATARLRRQNMMKDEW